MKNNNNLNCAIVALLLCVAIKPSLRADDAPAPAVAAPANVADKLSAGVEKHTKEALKALALTDPAKEAKVHDIIAAHMVKFNEFHAVNDSKISELWHEFDEARKIHDAAKADAALDKVGGVYAAFKSEHDSFNTKLGEVLTPEQVEAVKDAFTIKKVAVTFHAYEEIYPGLTAAQKEVVLKLLKDAREEAIDASYAEKLKEKSAFFKKYKIKIEEGYLTKEGYDMKKARKIFDDKQKAEIAAKKEKNEKPAEKAAEPGK